jgi:ABC-type sugar transport system ATPase subunit
MVGRELKEFFHKRAVAARAPVLEVEGLVAAGAPAGVSFAVRGGAIVGFAARRRRRSDPQTIAGTQAPRGRVRVGGRRAAGHRRRDRHPSRSYRRQAPPGLVLDASIRERVARALEGRPLGAQRAQPAADSRRQSRRDAEAPCARSRGNQRRLLGTAS